MKQSPKYFNYYDIAPEYNEQFNARGFRNFMIVVLFIISIVLFFTLKGKANVDTINSHSNGYHAVCFNSNLQ